MSEGELQPHQLRVVNENNELVYKLSKLSAFMKTDYFKTLPLEECMRLARQHDYMMGYHDVLVERIATFNRS